MIGKNTGAEDFAWRARVVGQGNRTKDVLQAGERIARCRLDTVGKNFLRRAMGGDFLGPG